MRTFTTKCLIAVILMTAIQILPPQPTLANPFHRVPPQTNDSTSKHKSSNTGLVLLSDPEGLDWAPYIRHVYLSIKQKWTTTVLPESAKRGETGTVRIEFRIQQDGRVPEDSLFVISSGKKDMDDACLAIIRAAGPFEHLPEAYHGPFIKLRQTFFFGASKNSE